MAQSRLDGTGTRKESRVFQKATVSVHSVINGTFDVVHLVLSGTSKDQSSQTAVFRVTLEDGHFLGANFGHVDFVGGTNFFLSRSA